MISKDLLKKLICPLCQGDLDFQEEILFCSKCHQFFKVENNLFNFLPDKFLDPDDSQVASWKRTEIERFEDLESYKELMRRPYFRYLKNKIRGHLLGLKLKEKSILEVGAGISIFASLFDNSNLVILTDINGKLLSQNQVGRFLVVADAENLPFKDNSFDFVYTIGLLHHLPNQLQGLKELERIIKPRGQIFISEPTKWSLNLPYYLGRHLLLKFLGLEGLKKLTGCGTPYESFIDLNKVANVFREWQVKKKYLLPLRLLPLRIIDRLTGFIPLNRFLEKIPLIKRLGTIVFLDIYSSDKERGYGTEYEKFVLKGLFKELINKYHIKSVSEFPSNNFMGDHQEIFENLEVEFREESPDLVWNFCEFEYADSDKFLEDLKKLNSKYLVIITQNNKNIGVWFHRLYHWLLGKNWNHGKISKMSYQKVVGLTKKDSELKIKEILAFDIPWFILDVYETGKFIRKILPRGFVDPEIKLSPLESWSFDLKKFLAHHFLIFIERI